ncbi:MAG: hypothetical protein MUP81_06405 [Dehalococcoidia bacterium]|nr:hypothetical protein [Dehalococcoidia bacterium]
MKKLLILAIVLALFLPIFLPASVQAIDRPELISPIGSASGDSVLFEWDYEGDVDEFRLEVWNDDYLVFKEYLDENICDEGSADYGISIDVGSGSNEIDLQAGYQYEWKIRAYFEGDAVSSWSHTESFWYEIIAGYPAITISPVSGDTGDSVTIRGYGWQDGEDVEIYVDREKIKTLRNVDDDWSTRVTIKGYGSQSIRAKGKDSGWSNYAWFLVEGPDVEIDLPKSGQVGDIIEVSGKNWLRNEDISLTFKGFFLDSIDSGSGSWQVSFMIPESPAGNWPVMAWSRSAQAEDYLEVIPGIVISPESTGPGQPVMVKGTGFASSSNIRIALNTATYYSNTGIMGSFAKEIKSPSESGSYIIEVRDSHGNLTSGELSVGGIINVLPPILYIGNILTIQGSSFTPERNVEITCDGSDLISGEVDIFGNFILTTKPKLTAGRHTITAIDGKVSASATFEVESQVPGIPNPSQPFNNKKLLGTKINLGWYSVHDDSGVIYEVKVGNTDSISDSIIATAIVSENKAAITVPSDGTYYWQVRSIDGAGNTSNWSSVNSFEVHQTIGIILGSLAGLLVACAIGGTIWWQRRKK